MSCTVIMSSGGGTRRPLYQCDTYQEALDFCNYHNWHWLDNNLFDWTLEIEED